MTAKEYMVRIIGPATYGDRTEQECLEDLIECHRNGVETIRQVEAENEKLRRKMHK